MLIPNELKPILIVKINDIIRVNRNHSKAVSHFNRLKKRILNNKAFTVKMKENLCFILEDLDIS